MNPILRNILAFIAGVVVGGFVNMGVIMISGSIITPPEGADVTTMEGLEASIHLFQPKHFIMPFLAHALGTFVGALLTALLAKGHQVKLGIGIGVFYLLGGIANVLMLPSPTWFIALDLGLAYIPMGYFGAKFIAKQQA